MGAVRFVILPLGIAQQGERAVRVQRRAGQRHLQQAPHLRDRQRRAFFPPRRRRARTKQWCARKVRVT